MTSTVNPNQQQGQNVDPAELAKFEALASRWWDRSSEFKPLHDINPLRLDYIDTAIGLQNKTVVDVGCGGGILSEGMADKGAHVTGIDLGDTPLKVAELHREESGIDVHYEKISAEAFADKNTGTFDVVTCMELLEHVPEPSSTIDACARLLKPGGTLVLSTINRNPKSYLFAIVGAEYLLNLLPRGTHDYAKFIRPSELDQWCRQTDLSIEDITGMSYNPITKRYWLNHDVSVNFFMRCKKSG